MTFLRLCCWLRGSSDDFWMVQVTQTPTEMNQNEEIHAVVKMNE